MKKFFIILSLSILASPALHAGARIDKAIEWVRNKTGTLPENNIRTVLVSNDAHDLLNFYPEDLNDPLVCIEHLLKGTKVIINGRTLFHNETCAIKANDNTLKITVVTAKDLYESGHLKDHVELSGFMKYLAKYMRGYIVFTYVLNSETKEVALSEIILDKLEQWGQQMPKFRVSCGLFSTQIELVDRC